MNRVPVPCALAAAALAYPFQSEQTAPEQDHLQAAPGFTPSQNSCGALESLAQSRILIWDPDTTTSEPLLRSVNAWQLQSQRAAGALRERPTRQMFAQVEVVFFALSNEAHQLAFLLQMATECAGLEVVYYVAEPSKARAGLAMADLLALHVNELPAIMAPAWQEQMLPLLVRRAQARRAVAQLNAELELVACAATVGADLINLPLPAAETAFRTFYVSALIERYPGLRQAAKRAGVSHTTLLNMLRKLNIERAGGGVDCAG